MSYPEGVSDLDLPTGMHMILRPGNSEGPFRKITEWHAHFALCPVRTLDGKKLWLQWCERKVVTCYPPLSFDVDGRPYATRCYYREASDR